MSVIAEQTVGNIRYQLISDIYPVHSAVTGSIAISKIGRIFSAIAPYEWISYHRVTNNGQIYSYSNTSDSSTYTVENWVNMSTLTWTKNTTIGELSGFTQSNEKMILNFDDVGYYLVTTTYTNICSSNNKLAAFESGPSKNNIIPYRYNGGIYNPNINWESSNMVHGIYELDGRLGDYVQIAHKAIASTGSSGRLHASVTVEPIGRPVTFYEYGNSSAFTTCNWVTANDTVNKWFMGGATTFSGGGTAMYVSSAQTTNLYDNTVAQVSHVYKDFSFPLNLDSSVYLSFYWKCNGESGFDYGSLYFGPSSALTPTAGVALSDTYRILNFSGQTTYSATTNLVLGTAAALSGTTQRLIFSWRNDSSLGTNPPLAVDSLRLHYYVGRYKG
jgi:hypothetical protein